MLACKISSFFTAHGILELLTYLNTNAYNGENCTSVCKNLNGWPVLKARNIRYQVLTFDRKDSL